MIAVTAAAMTTIMAMTMVAAVATAITNHSTHYKHKRQDSMRNTFGHLFTLTTFGESHGAAVGGVVDGMPPGIDVDMDFIQHELNRRRPGQSSITTSRQEEDRVELLSGVLEGKTTGCPIGFVVRNQNQHSNDYNNLRNLFRPSHADYTYYNKYGIRDHRGGGRSSARITLSRCVGGALAKLALKPMGITIQAYTSQVGSIKLENDYRHYDLSLTEQNAVRCPDEEKARQMEQLIKEVKAEGDTIGGVITCVVRGCPVGLGEPEFDKLHAQLGAAMLSINAVKGFEYGEGFAGVEARGSEQNDVFVPVAACGDGLPSRVRTTTNHSGGIQGGISNGQDICFRVAFKPVATLLRPQQTVDINGTSTTFTTKGRHDPCVLPRAVPVVEAMAAMTFLDNYLLNNSIKNL
jgi:chorismate synthase